MKLFPLADVRLSDGVFRDAQLADLEYLLTLDPDRLLAPYRREAGIAQTAPSYGNWESAGLDGHTAGHALSAAVLLHAATGDERVASFATSLVDGLAQCQEAIGTGYVGGVPHGTELWARISSGDVSSDSFGLNGAWVPWYNLHKMVAGLIDAVRLADRRTADRALRVVTEFADWWLRAAAGMDDATFEGMLRTEFGGMCEAFADLAELTGRSDYLDMARRFAHRATLEPLLAGRDELDGLHANTQIAKVVGYQRVAAVTGDAEWSRAARLFWENVVHRRTLAFGGNSVREHFHPVDDFSGAVTSPQGPETCNTANMLELTRQLFLAAPEPALVDYYERATVNHILSSQHPDGGFVYFTPARPGHYRVYSQPEEGFWCCVGTGLENHARYGEMVFTHEAGDLFVNLTIPSRLTWRELGAVVHLESEFPAVDRGTATRIRFELGAPQTFVLHLRTPGWLAPDADLDVRVNGRPAETVARDDGYVAVRRAWADGDVVSYRLPAAAFMDRLPDGSEWAALRYGPVVLAARSDIEDLLGFRADDSRMGHIASGPLQPLADAPVLTLEDDVEVPVRPDPHERMTFTVEDAWRRPHVLEPFHSLHDTRYTLYFPLAEARPGAREARRAELASIDDTELALAAQTVDQVTCGEQQPESDHRFAGSGTWSGAGEGAHWRVADGWFEYTLTDPDGTADVVQLVYRGTGDPTAFSLTVGDVLVAEAEVPADASAGVTTRHYRLDAGSRVGPPPEGSRVRIAAGDGRSTPEILEVRLLAGAS